ncbi:MAG: carbon monoxide dehydrogenase subunit G [Bryobacteraceae bacterium]
MKISGSYTLPLPRERAYDLLQDPDVLARAIPGCDSLVKSGDGEYQMKMKMSIASISGAFDGKVKLTDRTPPSSFRMLVEGAGKIGFLKGDGLLTLAANGESTAVSYDGDVQVGGTIAAVGQRLIDTTSKMIIKRFFDKLAAEAAA